MILGGIPGFVSERAAAERPAGLTTGFAVNYNLTLISLPDFNSLSSYLYNNHNRQYPIWDYSGRYADSLVYVGNSTRFEYYDPYTHANGNISAPVTLLYQTTTGLEDQIDNEFALDTPGDVATAYGNLTTSPGPLTVETVFLSNGTVRTVTTPVQMGNDVESIYIGNGDVVTFNSTPSSARSAYFTNVWNGTSWYSGQDVGFAAGNVYWCYQLGSFINLQGNEVEQYAVRSNHLVRVANVWFNDSKIVNHVSGVQGILVHGSQIAIEFALDSATADVAILNAPNGVIQAGGSYSYPTPYWIYEERYAFTSTYTWATYGTLLGASYLFDPFNNASLTVPGLVSRVQSSGGWGNYEFSDPTTTATYFSLNASLVNRSLLGPNQLVFAVGPPSPSGGGTSTSGVPFLLGLPIYVWAAILIAVAAAIIVFSVGGLRK